jgi:hypothetical protein
MPDQEAIDQQRDLLAAHRRTLAQYLKQQALAGEANVPPAVWNGIVDARENIRRIKRGLRDWGAPVANHPDDESPGQTQADESSSIAVPLPYRPAAGESASFSAGPPIAHPRHFFGRERELRRLFNLWQRPPLQNAALIAPRRAGKTSLLLHLAQITATPSEQLRPGQRADWLPAPERYRWVFVDFQDPRLGRREGLLRTCWPVWICPRPSRAAWSVSWR